MGKDESESFLGFAWNFAKTVIIQERIIIKQIWDLVQKNKINPVGMSRAIVAMGKTTSSIKATRSLPHCYISNNKSCTQGIKIFPKAICIYMCDNGKKATDLYKSIFNVKYLGDRDNLSVHALVDYEKSLIYQTLPWDCRGVHQFNDDLDNSCIGIVICGANPFYGNGSDVQAYEMLVKLVAWLFNTCKIPVAVSNLRLQDKNASNIISNWKKTFMIDVQKQIDKGVSQEDLKQYFVARDDIK